MANPLLELRNLHVSANGAPIIKGVDLVISEGQTHALMGPNGAGKSTLASAIMGHPNYSIDAGDILFHGESIANVSPDSRARAGVFLAFQYPEAITGVSVVQFLRQAIAARRGLEDLSILEVRLDLAEWMDRLGMDSSFAERHLNQGFSGGERKRNEILQMALLRPELALLDETDSGLDIDALRIVANGVRLVRSELPLMGALVVTHYVKLLEELSPEHVHILVDGQIVESGGPELAQKIEISGYDEWRSVSA